MKRESTSTRRSFLRGGAILAAPIAAAAVPVVALAEEPLKARGEHLIDEAAIREVHQSWLRRVNAGEPDALLDSAVSRIFADHAGAPDSLEIAADGRTAVGRFDYVIEMETPLDADCTLAQMAHAQGNGSVRRTERRLLTIDYAKSGGRWTIVKVASATI